MTLCIDMCIYTTHTGYMSSYRTFTATTFRTQRDFLAAAEANVIEVVRVTPADEDGKLFDAAYTCSTDTYPNAVTVIRVNKAAARRLGLAA